MGYEELRNRARKQPFEPFRIVLTTGETFDVWRQDGYFLSRRCIYVGMPGETGGTDYHR
jgi:hypothetical protein